MRKNQVRFLWLGISILGMLVLSPGLMGQASSKPEAALPATTDWSQHHLIFSKPATAGKAKLVERDPRYWQQLRRQSPARLSEPKIGGGHAPKLQSRLRVSHRGRKHGLEADWAEDIGGGATVGAINYPAKYPFGSKAADCVNDFVVYGTGLAGSGSQAGIVAYNNLYSGCIGLALGTAANFAILGSATVTNAGNTVVTGANIGISPGTSLTGFPPGELTPPAAEYLGDAVASQAQTDAHTAYTYYQGLPGAVVLTSPLDGQTLTPGLYKAGSSLALSASATVTLDGNGIYIFQVGSTLELAGTVALSGGAMAGNVIWLVGSSATLDGTAVAAGDIIAQASITMDSGASLAGRAIALVGAITMIDNAVTTVDTVPAVYWAYDTSGGRVTTSPVFSLDGTQIAFVQTDSFRNGVLVLLKWAASGGTVSTPTTLMRVRNSAYPTCTAPCMATSVLRDSNGVLHPDSNSSVFYDYGGDTAYVGDDGGWLHKFNPVFNGIPTEVRSGGWPVHVNPGTPTALTSPVYDSVSGSVLVADVGGFLYRVDPGASVTSSGRLDVSKAEGGAGIVQGPIVDSTSELVYVFASADGSGSCSGGADCAAVYELHTDFVAGTTGLKAKVGTSTVEPAPPSPLFIGAFDSTYENSANASGNLYVCGNTGGPPILYQVNILAGILGTVTVGPTLSGGTGPTPCSPVTDFLNPNASGGATEWMFASVEREGLASACAAGGCIFNFKDTPWLPSTAYAVGQEVLDSNLHIEVVSVAGTSGATTPSWSSGPGGTTTDGGVTWLNQGPVSASTVAGWATSHAYSLGAEILDANDNIELVTTAGTSAGPIPAFNTTAGGITHDGTITWTNVGAIATAAMAAAGGTSGIIIDNIVGSGMLVGASQIYFSTLSDQTCATSGGTGGCAVQASQSALQ